MLTFKQFNENKEETAYQKFFKAALDKFGVDEPDELEGEKEKEFYDYVDKNWESDKEEGNVNESKILKNPDNNKLMSKIDKEGNLKTPGLAVLKRVLLRIEDGEDAQEAFNGATTGAASGIKKEIKKILSQKGIL